MLRKFWLRLRAVHAAAALCVAAALALQAQTYTTLYSFCSDPNCADGVYPQAALIQGANGGLYGTMRLAGYDFYNAYGGSVFKITTGGSLTTLYTFCPQSGCADGQYPFAGLIQANQGDFYGTATEGGLTGNYGTIFKITPTGAFTRVFSFDGVQNADGSSPYGALIQATNSYFYGTTTHSGPDNEGTVFEITPDGTFTTLYSFCSQPDCTDGYDPLSALIQASNGEFYGTTALGGANTDCQPGSHFYGCGTIFRMSASGALKTLYSFCSQSGCTDGAGPNGGLVEASDGDFYGTTLNGGSSTTCNLGCGTIFKITPGGDFTTLYSFCSQPACADGSNPYDGLIEGSDRSLYGTASFGGAYGGGTIFRITPQGGFSTLYSFCSQSGCPDGENPSAGLAQDTNGDFYGTAVLGGANGAGTVFSLSVGLGAFVKTLPTSGHSGTTVKILGTALAGATSVTFNGSPAKFAVLSPSEISTTVPANATTGKVQVVTPGGTLSSNVVFRVP